MEVKFIATYNQNRKCIAIDGDGQAEIKFTTDATQLASVLGSLASFKDSQIEIRLRRIDDRKQRIPKV